MDGENNTEVTQPQTQNSTPSTDNTQLMSILAYIGILSCTRYPLNSWYRECDSKERG